MDFLTKFGVFDLFIGFIGFFSIIFGFLRGFIFSILSFTVWIFSIYFTILFAPFAKQLLSIWIKSDIALLISSNTIIFIVSLILFNLCKFFITGLLGQLMGGVIDRSLGALFGLVRALCISSIVFLSIIVGINTINGEENIWNKENTPNFLKNSRSYQIMTKISEDLEPLIPKNLSDEAKDLIENIDNKERNERFVETIKEKLKSYIDETELNRIQQKKDSMVNELSKKDLEKLELKELLDSYKKTLDSGKEKILSEEDIEHINKIISGE